MKLYDASVTPNCRRVRIFLAEKGITIPLVPVDLAKLEHKKPEYEAINPVQQVPALELDDGTIITESVAICRYFEEIQSKPSLLGATIMERVEIEMWQRRLEINLFMPVMAVFRHSHPAMAEMESPQIPAWSEANKPRVLSFLKILNEHLRGRYFICAEKFTVADITALVAIDFLRPARLTIPEEMIHILRWHREVSERPSTKA